MREVWTGKLIGELHNAEITPAELARELGIGKAYMSLVLHGHRHPRNAEERFNKAFHELLRRRAEERKQK